MQRLNRAAHAPVGAAFFLFLVLAILPISLGVAGVQVSFNPRLSAAMDAWRAQLIAATAGVSWFFSPPGPCHVLVGGDQGWALGPAGSTLGGMVSRFFNDGPPERVMF